MNGDIIATLGHGRFATVKCSRDADFNLCAIKQYDRKSTTTQQRSARIILEKQILSTLCHPYIIKYIGTFKDDLHLSIVMECALGGPLHKHIQNSLNGKLGVHLGQLFGAQLVSALHHMAKIGCAHRDIKASNLILDSKGHIKICDFGCSKLLYQQSEYTNEMLMEPLKGSRTYTVIGSSHIFLPELVALSVTPTHTHTHPCHSYAADAADKTSEGGGDDSVGMVGAPALSPRSLQRGYGIGCDWWALGVVLFEVITGRWPFPRLGDLVVKQAQQQDKTRTGGDAPVPVPAPVLAPGGERVEGDRDIWSCFNLSFDDTEFAENLSLRADQLIGGLLCVSPEDRWGPWDIEQIRNHSFFAGTDWQAVDSGEMAPIAMDERLGFMDLLGAGKEVGDISQSDQMLFDGF